MTQPAPAHPQPKRQNALRRSLLAASFGALSALALWRMLRVIPLAPLPAPRPAHDYAAALARVAGIQAADSARVNPACRTELLSHGRRTEKAIALLHGLTNCPAQFVQFGKMLHLRGYNVYMPRLKYHGLERASTDFGALRAEEMAAWANETSDILRGLGEETILLGFSTGGAAATWAAQQRADLDHVILIAPALALHGVSVRAQRFVANLARLLPNRSIWWDPVLREDAPGPPHAYPRAMTHVVGELLRLGLLVETQAKRQIYAARKVTVITNPTDEVVDNARTQSVVEAWRAQGAPVATWSFQQDWALLHDIFDPTKPGQQIARTYPQLLEWLEL